MYRRSIFWFYLAILSAAASVYLLGNDTVGLWDRDEPRYAQTSRQMLQSGDWVVPHFLNTVRNAKPIFIYWCQAFSMKYLGDNAFAARFPSVIAMLLTLILLAVTLSREKGSSAALWTIFIFSSCALAIGSAKMCLTDSVLLLFITISQLCIYRIWKYGLGVGSVVMLGLSIGLAGLTKGPVVLGINLTTIAVLAILSRKQPKNQVKQLQTVPTIFAVIFVLGLVTMVVFPWMWEVSHRSPGFITGALDKDVMDRMKSGQEGHSFPPGFYTLAMFATFFPWSLLVPAAIFNAWRNRNDPTIRFALAAIIGPWVMFELIVTKLPHYVLPTYPALAYLVADMLIRAASGQIKDLSTKLATTTVWIWAVVIAAGGAGPLVAIRLMKLDQPYLYSISIIVLAITMLMTFGTAWRFQKGNFYGAARTMGLGMFLLVAVIYSLFLPWFEPVRLSQGIAKIMRDSGGYGASGMMIDYKEPSLAFHAGGGLIEQSENEFLNTASESQWPGWVIITRAYYNKISPEKQANWQIIGILRGWTLNEKGQSEILVLRKKA